MRARRREPPGGSSRRWSITRSAFSNEGGVSFSGPVSFTPDNVNAADFPSKPVVDSDGSVTVAWRTFGIEGLIQVARSSDGGASWGSPVDVTKVTNTGTARAG